MFHANNYKYMHLRKAWVIGLWKWTCVLCVCKILQNTIIMASLTHLVRTSMVHIQWASLRPHCKSISHVLVLCVHSFLLFVFLYFCNFSLQKVSQFQEHVHLRTNEPYFSHGCECVLTNGRMTFGRMSRIILYLKLNHIS